MSTFSHLQLKIKIIETQIPLTPTQDSLLMKLFLKSQHQLKLADQKICKVNNGQIEESVSLSASVAVALTQVYRHTHLQIYDCQNSNRCLFGVTLPVQQFSNSQLRTIYNQEPQGPDGAIEVFLMSFPAKAPTNQIERIASITQAIVMKKQSIDDSFVQMDFQDDSQRDLLSPVLGFKNSVKWKIAPVQIQNQMQEQNQNENIQSLVTLNAILQGRNEQLEEEKSELMEQNRQLLQDKSNMKQQICRLQVIIDQLMAQKGKETSSEQLRAQQKRTQRGQRVKYRQMEYKQAAVQNEDFDHNQIIKSLMMLSGVIESQNEDMSEEKIFIEQAKEQQVTQGSGHDFQVLWLSEHAQQNTHDALQ